MYMIPPLEERYHQGKLGSRLLNLLSLSLSFPCVFLGLIVATSQQVCLIDLVSISCVGQIGNTVSIINALQSISGCSYSCLQNQVYCQDK